MQLYAAPDAVGGTANDTLGVMISAPSPMLACLDPFRWILVFEAGVPAQSRPMTLQSGRGKTKSVQEKLLSRPMTDRSCRLTYGFVFAFCLFDNSFNA
jgi:hypothetical protein